MASRYSQFESYKPWSPGDPPRHVPVSVRLRLLLGGFLNQFGWLFGGFGLVFVWIFGGTAALHDLAFFRGELATTDGVITAVVDARMSINEQPVHRFEYEYSVDGEPYTGATKGFEGAYAEGANIIAEYVIADPGRSRIQGLSLGGGLMFLLPMIFPLVGFGMVAYGLYRGLRGGRLLRNGKLATGELVSVEPTNTKINEQTVYKYTFRFRADDGREYEAIGKTHDSTRFEGEAEGDVGSDVMEFSDEEEGEQEEHVIREPLLYIPENPADSVLLDSLPGSPRIGDDGEITGSVFKLLPLLILPGLVFAGHGWWFLHVLEIV